MCGKLPFHHSILGCNLHLQAVTITPDPVWSNLGKWFTYKIICWSNFTTSRDVTQVWSWCNGDLAVCRSKFILMKSAVFTWISSTLVWSCSYIFIIKIVHRVQIYNKKAVLSQRWPRNAPYIWVPWNFLNVHRKMEMRSLSRSWHSSDWSLDWGLWTLI